VSECTPRFAQHQQRLAVEGKRHGDGVGAISRVDDVVYDLHAVRFLHGADAPAAEVVPVAIEYHHRRIFALENVNAILRIGRNPADYAEGFALGHFGPIADHFVGMPARADLFHCCFLQRFLRRDAMISNDGPSFRLDIRLLDDLRSVTKPL
jgi:hypothetical protein